MIKAVFWDFGGVITSSPFESFNKFETENSLPQDFLRKVNSTNPDANAWAKLESSKISLDEFIIAFFLTGTEPTLPVYLYSLLRFPQKLPIVMSLGTILLGLSLVLVSTAEYFRRRGVTKSGVNNVGGTL